jgi:hypothetical protein
MSTKPNQPKDPVVWIEHADKLLKLVESGHEAGNITKSTLKEIKSLIRKLDNLPEKAKVKLSKLTFNNINRRYEKGTLIADEKLIYQLNELRLTSVGEYWKRFGSLVAGANYSNSFYPLKLRLDQRESLEQACLFYLNQYEKHICDNYRYEFSEEFEVSGLKEWLESNDIANRGREKHKFDFFLSYILRYAMENEIASKEMAEERKISREKKG